MLIDSSALHIRMLSLLTPIFSQPTTISLSLFELLTCDALMHVVKFSFDDWLLLFHGQGEGSHGGRAPLGPDLRSHFSPLTFLRYSLYSFFLSAGIWEMQGHGLLCYCYCTFCKRTSTHELIYLVFIVDFARYSGLRYLEWYAKRHDTQYSRYLNVQRQKRRLAIAEQELINY